MSNSTIDLIGQHRSIRSYTAEKISNENIDLILKSAQAASSSNFLQSSTIIRITDIESRKELAKLSGNQPYIESAAEFWVFCADFNRHLQIESELDLGKAEHLLIGCVDTALMAQNAVIAAESLGLGCVYIGGIRGNIEEVSKHLHLPKHVLPLFGICMGYPAQDSEVKPRLPKELIFFENKYQPVNKASLDVYDQQMASYYQQRSSNQKDAGWSTHLKGIINQSERDFMSDYLRKQGWLKKKNND